MAKLKVYTLGVHGFIGDSVRDALGEPGHRRQATVLLVAESKAAAVRLVEEVRAVPPRPWGERSPSAQAPIALPRLSDPEFRVATGIEVDALRAAGLLDAPTVLVLPYDGWAGVPVVAVGIGGVVTRVGSIDSDGGGGRVYRPTISVVSDSTTKE